jgi:hypothetical protein
MAQFALFIGILLFLSIWTFSAVVAAASMEPLHVNARTHGDFGRCETTGYYVFSEGWTTYAYIKEGIANDIASRIARGMM